MPSSSTLGAPRAEPTAPRFCVSSTAAGPAPAGVTCLHAVAPAQELFMTLGPCHLWEGQIKGKARAVGPGAGQDVPEEVALRAENWGWCREERSI